MTSNFNKKIKIIQQDYSLITRHVSLSAELTQSAVSQETMAEILIVARNEGEEEARFYSGFWPVFGQTRSVESNPGLLLLPQSRNVRIDSNGFPRENDLVFDSTDKLNVIKPGEEMMQSYYVYNHPENETSFPIGTYRFTNRYTLADGTDVRWGFTIEVKPD